VPEVLAQGGELEAEHALGSLDLCVQLVVPHLFESEKKAGLVIRGTMPMPVLP
jgi:hypothetical protein